MFKKIPVSIICMVAILISGCAGAGWYHPNKSTSDFDSDKYACEREAAQSYPVQYSSQNNTSYDTNCTSTGGYTRNTNCTTRSNSYAPPPTDINKSNRSLAVSSCLRARGWSWQWQQKDKPMTRTQGQYN